MSDLFGNHIVGFPTRRLNYLRNAVSFVSCQENVSVAKTIDQSNHVLFLLFGNF